MVEVPSVAVVVDVMRAFTVAAWAVAQGAEKIVLAESLDEALALKALALLPARNDLSVVHLTKPVVTIMTIAQTTAASIGRLGLAAAAFGGPAFARAGEQPGATGTPAETADGACLRTH